MARAWYGHVFLGPPMPSLRSLRSLPPDSRASDSSRFGHSALRISGSGIGTTAIIFLATGFFSGFVPVMPGTAGSIVGAALWWGAFGPLWQYSRIAGLLVFGGLFVAGCWLAGRAEQLFGERDSPKIVIDEVAGMVATMLFVPAGWPALAAGFLLFRLFDVLKPYPASFIDRRMSGGLGVMLDDLVAAIYANLVLQIGTRLL